MTAGCASVQDSIAKGSVAGGLQSGDPGNSSQGVTHRPLRGLNSVPAGQVPVAVGYTRVGTGVGCGNVRFGFGSCTRPSGPTTLAAFSGQSLLGGGVQG